VPVTEAERDTIREQLRQILGSSEFRASKRCSAFLQYVVNHSLRGHTTELKERVIGVEVFGRAANYDTAVDPVVRGTAGEVRKRIAAYYHELGHRAEIRIDLPCGAYVPTFHRADEKAIAAVSVRSKTRVPAYAWALLAVAAVFSIVFLLKPWQSHAAIDQFWAPVMDSPDPVTICFGAPEVPDLHPDVQKQMSLDGVQSLSGTLLDGYQLLTSRVSLFEAIGVSRLAAYLHARGKPYEVRRLASGLFTDLPKGSAILIGARHNELSLRLTGQLRFSYEWDAERGSSLIKDQQSVVGARWTREPTAVKSATAYALISRFVEPRTGRMVVDIAGMGPYGNIAASSFLTDSAHMEALAKKMPKGWGLKNLQVVISTDPINMRPGTPRVVASYSW
jgi:hypothetical protein